MSNYRAPSASGMQLSWTDWGGEPASDVTMRWENEGWTCEVHMHADRALAILRMSAMWTVQQMLLFRDLDEPDLWLATDGHGRWGEMNGAHRTELDGCVDIEFAGTPFTNSVLTHRLPLHVGDTAELPVITIDVETLSVVPVVHRYTRVDGNSWEWISGADGAIHAVSVDEFGLVLDEHGAFRRTTV